jgi:hypothetical protein
MDNFFFHCNEKNSDKCKFISYIFVYTIFCNACKSDSTAISWARLSSFQDKTEKQESRNGPESSKLRECKFIQIVIFRNLQTEHNVSKIILRNEYKVMSGTLFLKGTRNKPLFLIHI